MSEQVSDGLREYVAGVIHGAWCKRATPGCNPMSYDYEAADQVLIAADVPALTARLARVEALVREAEERAGTSLSRTITGEPFPAILTARELRTALATCDHPGIEHGPMSYVGICPKCRDCKFIGHGPLCGDCYAASECEKGSE